MRGRHPVRARARCRPVLQWARSRVGGEEGFTLIEVLVAAILLVIGVLGVLALMDVANAATSRNKVREGATNLVREVVEDVDSLSYGAIDPTTVVQTLQAKPGLANSGSGPAWTVVRRGVTYSLTVSICSVDDPRDGTGAHDSTSCTGGAAAGTSDSQPIDYKRVTVRANAASSPSVAPVQQATLMFPGGNANVPAVTALTSAPVSPITDSTKTSVTFTATTDRVPAGVEWFVDDNPKGTATGSGSNWTFTWPISGVADGTYVVSARAYNGSGAYGPAYQLNFSLNRNAPLAPANFVAGLNPADSSVDSEWLANTEHDIVGYHVYRQLTSPTLGATTQVNCGTTANPVFLVTDFSCIDAAPLAPAAGTITAGAVSSAMTSNGTSLTISPSPGVVVAGDLLLATITTSGVAGGSLPSGWTLLRKIATANSNMQETTLYKVATASEPASYAFSASGSRDWTGGIVDYSGVDTSSPIDDVQTAVGASGNAVGPAVTTTHANDQVVEAVGFTGASLLLSVPTPPTGMTQRYSRAANRSLTLAADIAKATAGSTGAFTTAPNGVATGWAAQTIALNPKFKVNYWVTAVDYDPSGNLRDGPSAPPIAAYAPNTAPYPPTWVATPLTRLADGTTQLQWNASSGDPDSGDYVAFYRIYRDGQRYDRTGLGTDTTYVDPNPGATHTYQVRAVDSHAAESTPTPAVSG